MHKNNKYLFFNGKKRFIEVLQCSGEEMNQILLGLVPSNLIPNNVQRQSVYSSHRAGLLKEKRKKSFEDFVIFHLKTNQRPSFQCQLFRRAWFHRRCLYRWATALIRQMFSSEMYKQIRVRVRSSTIRCKHKIFIRIVATIHYKCSTIQQDTWRHQFICQQGMFTRARWRCLFEVEIFVFNERNDCLSLLSRRNGSILINRHLRMRLSFCFFLCTSQTMQWIHFFVQPFCCVLFLFLKEKVRCI